MLMFTVFALKDKFVGRSVKLIVTVPAGPAEKLALFAATTPPSSVIKLVAEPGTAKLTESRADIKPDVFKTCSELPDQGDMLTEPWAALRRPVFVIKFVWTFTLFVSEVRLPWLLMEGAAKLSAPTADKVAALEVPADAALPLTMVPPALMEREPAEEMVPWFRTL